MDLEGSGRILEVIGLADRLVGKAAGLAGGDEAGRQAGGERRSEHEPAGFGSDHEVDAAGGGRELGETVDGGREGERVGEEGRDVPEEDPRPGEVGDRADV